MVATKKFSRQLFNENDLIAKQAGFAYVSLIGANWVSVNKNDYGCDLVYKMPGESEDMAPHLLEVEVKNVWKGGPFPYPTIQVLERKTKYWVEGADLLLLAKDHQHFLLLKAEDILGSSLEEVANKYVFGQEFFYQVPVHNAAWYKLTNTLTSKAVVCNTCNSKAFHIVKGHTFMCEGCKRILDI